MERKAKADITLDSKQRKCFSSKNNSVTSLHWTVLKMQRLLKQTGFLNAPSRGYRCPEPNRSIAGEKEQRQWLSENQGRWHGGGRERGKKCTLGSDKVTAVTRWQQLLLSGSITKAPPERSYLMGMTKYHFEKKKCTVNFIYVFIKSFIPTRPLTCKSKSVFAKLNIWKYKSRLNYQKRKHFIYITKYN